MFRVTGRGEEVKWNDKKSNTSGFAATLEAKYSCLRTVRGNYSTCFYKTLTFLFRVHEHQEFHRLSPSEVFLFFLSDLIIPNYHLFKANLLFIRSQLHKHIKSRCYHVIRVIFYSTFPLDVDYFSFLSALEIEQNARILGNIKMTLYSFF